MKKELIIKQIAAILIAALVFTIVCVFVACNETNKEYIAEDENGKGYIGGKVYDMPAVINMLSTDAEAVALRATVKPENASNIALDWSLSWINPASEWASGKSISDYLTLTVDNKSNTALFSCKAPFGEKAKITVVSQDNNNAKAECTVNFVARVIDFAFDLYYTDEHSNKSLVSTIRNFGSDDNVLEGLSGVLPVVLPVQDLRTYYEFDVVPIYSDGTVLPDIPEPSGTIGRLDTLIPYETLEWAITELSADPSDFQLYVHQTNAVIYKQGFTVNLSDIYMPVQKTVMPGATSIRYQDLVSVLSRAGNRPVIRIGITGDITFNNMTKSNVTFDFGVTDNAFYKAVGSLELSDTELNL